MLSPSLGSMVQKGKLEALACALVRRLKREDLPSNGMRNHQKASEDEEIEELRHSEEKSEELARALLRSIRATHVHQDKIYSIKYHLGLKRGEEREDVAGARQGRAGGGRGGAASTSARLRGHPGETRVEKRGVPTLGMPTMPILRWFLTRPRTGFLGAASGFFAMGYALFLG